MTDYLLVHGPGQGSWVWGKVWGRMTAPVEHPPICTSRAEPTVSTPLTCRATGPMRRAILPLSGWKSV